MTALLSLNTSVTCVSTTADNSKIVTARQHEWQVTDDVEILNSGTCHRFLYGFTRGELHSTALAETQRAMYTLLLDNGTQVSTVRVVVALNVPSTHLLATY